jgi:hypothetical protein
MDIKTIVEADPDASKKICFVRDGYHAYTKAKEHGKVDCVDKLPITAIAFCSMNYESIVMLYFLDDGCTYVLCKHLAERRLELNRFGTTPTQLEWFHALEWRSSVESSAGPKPFWVDTVDDAISSVSKALGKPLQVEYADESVNPLKFMRENFYRIKDVYRTCDGHVCFTMVNQH